MKFLPTWSRLEQLHQLKLVRSMHLWFFLVPILAKILSKINHTADIIIFNSTFQVHLRLPFSWKVFYFSALSFVVAQILFHIRCPQIIKDHANYSHFKSEGKQVEQIKIYWEKIGVPVKFDERINLFQAPLSENAIQVLFWELHSAANSTFPIMRFNCTMFYLVGFVLITWVGVENLKWVISMC